MPDSIRHRLLLKEWFLHRRLLYMIIYAKCAINDLLSSAGQCPA